MKIWALLSSGVLIAWPGAATAQSGAPPVAAAPTAQDDLREDAIADVIVTAQRRSENLQNVPIAITAVTAEQMRAQGIVTTSDLTKVTPGLTIANTGGLVRPSLRGVNTTASGPGIENPIATYIDGVYIASIAGSLLSLGGVERVEVLRGPQGTLFGRNATGGLIHVVTKDPGDRPEGEVFLNYGNYETYQGSIYVAGPLAEGVGASLAVSVGRQGEGYGTNFTTGNDVYRTRRDIAVRNKWVFTPANGTKARLSLDYANRWSSTPLIGALQGRPGFFGAIREGSVWDVDQNLDSRYKLESGGASLRVDQDLGALTLVSITAYRKLDYSLRFDFDTGPRAAIGVDYRTKDDQFSQEVQLQSDRGPFKWVVGGYYFDSSSSYVPYTQRRAAQLPAGRTVTRSEVTAQSLAAFGQASYEIGSAGPEVTAGLRYTSEKRGIAGTTETFNGAGASLGLSYAPVDKSERFNKLTWRLAVSQKLSPNTLVYASYNRGFKAGSFQGITPNLPGFKPEVLDAYEAGVKTDALDRHLRINLAGFYYDYKDIQVATFENNAQKIYNGARARLYGVDLEVTAAIDRHLTITGSVEAIHDRFASFPGATIGRPQPNGSNLLVPGSADGNRLPFTADLTLSANVQYERRVLGGTGTLNFDYQYNDGYYTEPDNVLRQPQFDMLGASVGWTSDSGYSLSIWGRNLLDEEVATVLALTPSSSFAGYQPPRTYGATLGFKF